MSTFHPFLMAPWQTAGAVIFSCVSLHFNEAFKGLFITQRSGPHPSDNELTVGPTKKSCAGKQLLWSL